MGKEKLNKIVRQAFELLMFKILEGSLEINNEISLQLHFGVILQQLGKMYEFSRDDRFIILLETKKEITPTSKTPNKKARCDIELQFYHKNKLESKAYIEIKLFKGGPNETVTENRFSVMCDIENLEHYKDDGKSLCYLLVVTDNINHTINKANLNLCIGNGAIARGRIRQNGKEVLLSGNYTFKWESCNKKDKYYFLLIDV